MPAGLRLARLVDEFVATMYQHGIAVDRHVVEQEMQERVAEIAERLQTSPQTVLLDHVQDGWGRRMAAPVIAEIERGRLLDAGPPEFLSVRVAARLLTALGRAVVYAAANDDAEDQPPMVDLRQAGEAVAGLGQALDDVAPEQAYVRVPADVAAATRATLEVLHDSLSDGDWTYCPCGEDHGQAEFDTETLTAVRAGLLALPPATLTSDPAR